MTETTKALRQWPLPALCWSLAAVVGICTSACGLGETTAPVKPAVVVSPIRQPVGYYAMTTGRGPVLLNRFLSNKNLAGVELRDTWANVNPKPGVYNWSRIRPLIDQVKKAGKQYSMVILCGVDAPPWLKGEGVEYIDGYPAPWDRKMLGEHDAMLAALAKEIGKDTALVKVNAGGPCQESLEMYHSPKVLNQPNAFNNLVGAWALVCTSYADYFPGVAVSFNLSSAVRGGDGSKLTSAASKDFRGSAADKLARAVAKDAMRILGSRAIFQHDHLNAKPEQETDPIHKLILELGKQGRYIGFEQVTSSSDSRYGGTFEVSDKRVKAAGGKFFDVYQPDDAKLKPWK